jgi:hypothetical protein
MPTRNQSSHRERYPYHPDYHLNEVTDGSDGSRIVVTTAKYPSSKAVCFRVAVEGSGGCLVTDDGAIVSQLGNGSYDYEDYRHFDDEQIEHWRALNYIFKTRFGDGPACTTIIEAAGGDMDTALSRIIGATRNFIAAEVKGR